MRVKFGMVWTAYGVGELEVPDKLLDDDEIKEYILDNWDEIRIPDDGEYIPGSDESEFESCFEVYRG